MKKNEVEQMQKFLEKNFEKGETITRNQLINAILKEQYYRRGFAPEMVTGEAIFIALNTGLKVKGYTLKKVQRWSKSCSEKQLLERLKDNYTDREIAQIIGKTYDQVRNLMVKYKLKRDLKAKLKKEDLERDYPIMTMKEMEKKYGVAESTLYRYMKKYGIKRKSSLTNHRQRCIM